MIISIKNTYVKLTIHTLAKELERRLFEDGRIVYFLGIGNVLYGVDADIKNISEEKKEEHLRRLSEVAHLMMDAGIILIVTAVNLNNEDLKIIKTIVNTEKIETILIGDYKKSDLSYSLNISDINPLEDNLNTVEKLLKDKEIID